MENIKKDYPDIADAAIEALKRSEIYAEKHKNEYYASEKDKHEMSYHAGFMAGFNFANKPKLKLAENKVMKKHHINRTWWFS